MDNIRKRVFNSSGDGYDSIKDEKMGGENGTIKHYMDVNITSPHQLCDENTLSDQAPLEEETVETEEEEEEEEEDDEKLEELTKTIPQASDTLGNETIDEALASLPSKWRNYVVRCVFTVIMVSGLSFIVYLGPVAYILMIMACQLKCFHEIISIAYAIHRSGALVLNRYLIWYLLFIANYYFHGPLFTKILQVYFPNSTLLQVILEQYNYSISFLLYLIGFIWFVLTLKKKQYKNQIYLWVWSHLTCIFFPAFSYIALENTLKGLVWSLLPTVMVVLNDIMGYIFGFFFGKTPLIRLSPKKTWEGYIGACVSTVILGMVMAYYMCQYPYFVCPVDFDEENSTLKIDCQPGYFFQYQTYELPPLLKMFPFVPPFIHTFPFMFHALALALFSSILAPFGGFFASGFKRAFKIKDFGGTIPGHGGIMDRMDCQFLIILFVFVYTRDFIGLLDRHKLLSQFQMLNPNDQRLLFESIKKHLSSHH